MLPDGFSYFLPAAPLILAGLISYGTAPLIIRLSRKIGAIDPPATGRHIHTDPVPRLGGLAVFASSAISISLFTRVFSIGNTCVCLGALLITLLGFLDDIFSLDAKPKLAIQFAAAILAVFPGGLRIGHPVPSGIPSGIITVLWIIAVVNAFNFIDGLNGLCCGLSGIASLCLLIIALFFRAQGAAVAAAALLGSAIGFLPYNMPRAKLFLGDTGSTLFGFLLACLSIRLVWPADYPVPVLAPLLLFALPVADACRVVLARLLAGRNPMVGDRSHFHHRLLDRGFSPAKIRLIAFGAAAITGTAAILLTVFCVHPY